MNVYVGMTLYDLLMNVYEVVCLADADGGSARADSQLVRGDAVEYDVDDGG